MTWNYSNTSVETTLSGGISSSATTMTVGSTSGLPVSFPYTLVIDFGQSNVEVVTVTGLAGSSLTVTRGQDGTAAQTHNAGAKVVHGVVARDLREPQQHVAASSDVHGIGASASVVGTDTAQTLTNKTMSGPSLTVSGAVTAGSLSITAGQAAVTRATATNPTFTAKVTGDTNDRFSVQADGKASWGPGNAAADTNLYRSAGSTLKTDGAFDALGQIRSSRSLITDSALQAAIVGDTIARFAALSGGTLEWGAGGAAARDTNLYRSAANTLKTDDSLVVGGSVTASDTVSATTALGTDNALTAKVTGDTNNRFSVHSDGSLFWGPGSTVADTKLYRSAANTLKTDDDIIVAGTLTLGATARNVLNELEKPVCRLVQQAAQTLGSGIAVALTFTGTEDIDTHGFHNPASNPSRITPTRPGIYRLHGIFHLTFNTSLNYSYAALYKNGSALPGAPQFKQTANNNVSVGAGIADGYVTANGTTDYFELYGYQASTGGVSLDTYTVLPFVSIFECEYIRPL